MPQPRTRRPATPTQPAPRTVPPVAPPTGARPVRQSNTGAVPGTPGPRRRTRTP